MRNLFDGIKLDTYDMFIPYTLTRSELIKCLEAREIPIITTPNLKEWLYVKSEMLGTRILCSVAFAFSISKMVGVAITPLPTFGSAEKTFYILQDRLELLLGKRGKASFLQQLFGAISGGNEYTWKIDGLYIEHTLVDRCGLVDSTYIKIDSN